MYYSNFKDALCSKILRHCAHLLFTLAMPIIMHGQEVSNGFENPYYLSSKGKVYLEPDYSSVALYLRDEVTNKSLASVETELDQLAKSEQIISIKDENLLLFESKRMLKISAKDDQDLFSMKTDGKAVLKSAGLESSDDYEIVPSFRKEGKQMWLTKQISVKLKDEYSLEDVQPILDQHDASFEKAILGGSVYMLSVSNVMDQFSVISSLDNASLLEWATPDPIFERELIKHNNDPYYEFQYYLNNTGGSTVDGEDGLMSGVDINAPEAWDIATGQGITVVVVDDGVNPHEDFNLSHGYTPGLSGGDGTSYDLEGHGASVAGIIGGLHNGKGIKGVAPGVTIISINVFAAGYTDSEFATAMEDAIDDGADVFSLSIWMSDSEDSDIINDAFDYAANSGRGGLGCPIVVAAGNIGSSQDIGFPANLPYAITVGQSDPRTNSRYTYSGTGSELDLMAPSVGSVVTTDLPGLIGYDDGDYTFDFGGTSAATPMVSGVAALVLSVDPTLTDTEVKNLMNSTASPMYTSGWDTFTGHGRVDAYAAVVAAGGSTDTSSPTTISRPTASNITASTLTLNWSASSDNTGVLGYELIEYKHNGSSWILKDERYYTTDTELEVKGLDASSSYIYRVRAYDGRPNYSSWSSQVVVTTSAGSSTCNGTITSFPYAESFESGDGWTQVSGDDGDWIRLNSPTATSWTGPPAASALDYYLYLESSSSGVGSNAEVKLISPCFDFTQLTTPRLYFDYHMYGSNMGSLELQIGKFGVWETLWVLSGNQGNDWSTVEILLEDYVGTENVQLQFVGNTGNGVRSDIAIDNIVIAEDCIVQDYDYHSFDHLSFPGTDWGIWNDGGTDCAIVEDVNDIGFASGSYAAQLRDNSSTSLLTTDNIDLSSYEYVEVQYRYYASSMEDDEGWVLEVSTNGGASYSEIGNWYYPESFDNDDNAWFTAGYAGSLTTQTRFRFRGDGNDDSDVVYIDNIDIRGCKPLASIVSGAREATQEEGVEDLIGQNDIVVYPNPTADNLFIKGASDGATLRLVDSSGRVIIHQEVNSQMDISQFQNGIYFLQIVEGNYIKSYRIIKE